MQNNGLNVTINTGKQKPLKATFLSTSALIKAAFMSAAIGFSAIGTAHAQSRTIQNPSFEDGPRPGSFLIHSDTLHPGWESTNGEMETWADGFLGRDAQDGDYLVELNPTRPIGLYQEICLISGENLSWDLQHAARGTSGNQTILYEVVSLDGATTHQQLFSNTVTGMGSSSSNNALNLWDNVTGSSIYNGPTGVQRLQFRSTNSGTNGNFLDNIQVDLVPLINFDGTNTSDFENVNVNVNLPVLTVMGVVTSPLTIMFDATPASTATEGVDYDFVTKTITIPAGTYDGTSTGSLFLIPLTIFEDGDHTEADETIIIEVVSALAADPAFNPVIANDDCTVTQQSASITHTILNTLLVESAAESFPPIDGAAGGVTTSVLASDELNGAPVDPADVTLTVGTSDPELSLDPATGFITVAAGTPAGTYTVEYTICEIANPTNCSTVVETVTVNVPQPSLSMTKVADDTGPHAPGDVVTYTYTATNDGNVNINDVTVSDVHNGSAPLGPLTLGTLTNTSGLSSDDGADAVFDVLAPGDVIDFTAAYVVTATDLIAGGPVTNTATATGAPSEGTLTPPTASESISLSGTPRPALTPGVCGSFIREGFIIDPGSSRTEVNADFGSGAAGPAPFDPYVLEPLFGRDASTGVVSFYQTSADASATGSFLANGVALANSNNIANTTATVANPTSEIWRVAARLDGIPGTTETITIDNAQSHEHTAYWQTDINGAIINTNSSSNAGHDDGWIFGTATTTPGADGTTYTIDVTYPADGIVILQFALLDSTGAFGGINFDDYECPAPSLTMTKVADSEGPHLVGDVVTYTYTVTNDGNQNINGVAITDTHNGSNPAPVPGNETLLTDTAPTGDSTDAGVDGSWDVLAPGDALTFTGTYTITQTDAENL